jgi:serine/threonine-protein kinase
MTDETETETTDLTGQRIGNYQIIELLGKGSMGEVYLARHPVLSREVAVKVLPQELSLGSEAEARFRREAKAESQVQHPSIVEVYDFGTLEDGRMYYVMERLKGPTLAEHLEEHKRLTLEETLAIIGPVMGGLAKAHKAGVIHRDLKPDNIVLATDEDGVLRPKIIDFGIAKSGGMGPEGASVVSLVTRVGTFLGTPLYMSPEQVPGSPDQVGPWSDIYTVGVVVFHMLAGAPPFIADTPMKMAVHHLNTPPPPLDVIRPDLPPEVDEVVRRALAKKPDERFPDMGSFLEALESVGKEQEEQPAEAAVSLPPTSDEPPPGLPEEDGLWVDRKERAEEHAKVMTDDGGWAAHPRVAPKAEVAETAPVGFIPRLKRNKLWVLNGIVGVVVLVILVALFRRIRDHSRYANIVKPVRAVHLSLGSKHGCATISDGTARCWGANKSGQLGIGSFASASRPAQVANLTAALETAAGKDHTCAVKKDGTVWCWGNAAKGQLGSKRPAAAPAPVQVGGLSGVRSITAGPNHTCAVNKDRTVFCWGDNTKQQLGGKGPARRLVPIRVPGVANVRAVSAGQGHTCAVKEIGTVFCWGDNTGGQLGTDDATGLSAPVQLSLYEVHSIAAGDNHTCAVKKDGTVWCWGDNTKGQIGVEPGKSRKTPVQVKGVQDVRSVSAGSAHTCGLGKDGAVWCWGDNKTGQLMTRPLKPRHTPVKIEGLAKVRSVACGAFHTCALTDAGKVRCWGRIAGSGPILKGIVQLAP